MSDFLTPDGPVAEVPPLKSLKKNGEPYQRRPHVETQLGRIRPLPVAQLLQIVPKIYPESVVHLIVSPTESGAELWGDLFNEAVRRARRAALGLVSNHPKDIRYDIWTDIETR